MVCISTVLDTDIKKQGSFYYRTAGTDTVAYTFPRLESRLMPIGLVGVRPHEEGTDSLLEGMDKLQKWFYTLPTQLVQDVRADGVESRLKASRVLSDEYRRMFGGNAFFMIYFVGEKSAQQVYEIPTTVVLTSGYNPKAFTHDVLLYLLGKPAVAVLRERDKEGHLEITKAKALAELNSLLRGRYGKPLKAVQIPLTGHASGIVIPANGVIQQKNLQNLK